MTSYLIAQSQAPSLGEANGTKDLYVNYGKLLGYVGDSVCSGESGSAARHCVPTVSNPTGTE